MRTSPRPPRPVRSSGRREFHPPFHPWYLAFLIPFIALLWPPLYAKDRPELWGWPFFYWYQFLWLILIAILTQIVHVATRRSGR